MNETDSNPCIACGACCCSFRVSFYWGEADDAPGGRVPAELTVQINPFYRAMQGTHPKAKRCVALEGEVGAQVGCSIYDKRPGPLPRVRCLAGRRPARPALYPSAGQARAGAALGHPGWGE